MSDLKPTDQPTDQELISEYRSYFMQASGRVYATDRDTLLELHWAARLAFELARELWRRAVKTRDHRLTRIAARYLGDSMCLAYRVAEKIEETQEDGNDGT